jgi:hypothetical protein
MRKGIRARNYKFLPWMEIPQLWFFQKQRWTSSVMLRLEVSYAFENENYPDQHGFH